MTWTLLTIAHCVPVGLPVGSVTLLPTHQEFLFTLTLLSDRAPELVHSKRVFVLVETLTIMATIFFARA